MKRNFWFLVLFLMALSVSPAWAQGEEPQLTIHIRKDFGFRGGGRIQGKFSVRVDGPEDLARVVFLMDERIMSEDVEAPFQFTFRTGDYDLGVHSLSARGFTVDGGELHGDTHTLEFISAEEGWQVAMKVAVPIVIGVAAISILGIVVPVLADRRRGVSRGGVYGIAGGAVCKRCGLPFSRHALAPNLIAGKLERCPHCDKWGIVRRATPQELEQAEARLIDDSGRGVLEPEDQQDRLRRMIDDSRFER